MKKLILTFLSCLISFYIISQTDNVPKQPDATTSVVIDDEILTDEIFNMVDVMPTYKGGEKALFGDLAKQIIYPNDAIERNESGTVFVTFVIEKDGSISNARILRGKLESLDKEALRAVLKLQKWKPGMRNGKLVRVQYNLPIKFTLK